MTTIRAGDSKRATPRQEVIEISNTANTFGAMQEYSWIAWL